MSVFLFFSLLLHLAFGLLMFCLKRRALQAVARSGLLALFCLPFCLRKSDQWVRDPSAFEADAAGGAAQAEAVAQMTEPASCLGYSPACCPRALEQGWVSFPFSVPVL